MGEANKQTEIGVENSTDSLEDTEVHDHMCFDVYDDERLCVVGPTGCGRTTAPGCSVT